LRRGLRDHAVPVLLTIEEEPMQFSIFSVADHYPEELRTIRELYAHILDEIELADEQVSSRIRSLKLPA